MEILGWVILCSQLVFIFIIGVYFFSNLSGQWEGKCKVFADSKRELAAMKKMRALKLTEPLSEATRPKKLEEIIGQENGLLALRAAICSPNPQHVIIYGPPGVGKTAAARIMLSEAAKSKASPFQANAPFVELDATILQFDERSIADPLIGCVHDPIYNGAGIYGQAGIPHPRPGAVTKAHGGILFMDEIGELNNMQLNRLLKVLEDRKVIISSSYYSRSNKNIPEHIHDIFQNGLPADFRLIGATTKEPSEIPETIRSRCREIYFRPLGISDLEKISKNALGRAKVKYGESVARTIAYHAENGRDAVNIAASVTSLAIISGDKCIEDWHMKEVMEQSTSAFMQSTSKFENRPEIGSVLLPVIMHQKGMIAEIEAVAIKTQNIGKVITNGIAQTEEIHDRSRKTIKKSAALSSVENAIAALRNVHGVATKDYDIYINFPAQIVLDGPSAGCAVFCAVYSAIHSLRVETDIIITGEMSITGRIFPVGQIRQKIEAAEEYGIDTIIIPKANNASNTMRRNCGADIRIVSVTNSSELLQAVFGKMDVVAGEGPNIRLMLSADGYGLDN